MDLSEKAPACVKKKINTLFHVSKKQQGKQKLHYRMPSAIFKIWARAARGKSLHVYAVCVELEQVVAFRASMVVAAVHEALHLGY